jgi:putative NADH-flavin reductase
MKCFGLLSQYCTESSFLSWVIVVPPAKFNPGKRAGFPLLIRALAGGGADKVAL